MAPNATAERRRQSRTEVRLLPVGRETAHSRPTKARFRQASPEEAERCVGSADSIRIAPTEGRGPGRAGSASPACP